MYEMETGFDDNGSVIPYELETKRFDFDTPGLNKTFDYVDVIWYAALGTDISVKVKVDWEVQAEDHITDWDLQIDTVAKTIGTSAIWLQSITGTVDTDPSIDLYRYIVRIPMYAMWSDISINMSSDWWTWILEKMRISKNDEPVEVFAYWC